MREVHENEWGEGEKMKRWNGQDTWMYVRERMKKRRTRVLRSSAMDR